MPFTLTMPKLSPTMEEGTIVKWRIKEGDYVKSGDVLIEVATDKATVEHAALDEGYLRKIVVAEGGQARVNQPIAIFTEKKEESIEGYQLPQEPSAKKEEEQPVEEKAQKQEKPVSVSTSTMQMPAFAPPPPLTKYTFAESATFLGRTLASPLARKIAREKGIDLSTVKGSGPQGRIMSRDLDTGRPAALVQFGRQAKPQVQPGSYTEEPLTQMRKTVGKKLQESKTFIPHFYVTQEINAQPMIDLKEQLKEGQLKVTINDFIIRAAALALRQHPQVNSGFNTVNSTLIRYQSIDIAVAVSLPDGLITPIVRYADYKNLGDISSEMRVLGKKAKEGKLAYEEYAGGSFTISNLGMFGVRDFIAVINPPQAAILAVGGIQEKPVVRAGQVVPGKTISLTLSADHRVIDGVDSAKYLLTLQQLLENPALLVV